MSTRTRRVAITVLVIAVVMLSLHLATTQMSSLSWLNPHAAH
jgi:hypothetical protein